MAVENAPGSPVPADGPLASPEPARSVPSSAGAGAGAQPRWSRRWTAGWGRMLATGFAVGAVAAAGQLGLGYGLGLLRLARTFPNDGLWSSQLTWVAWFAIGAVLAGAAGARIAAGHDRLQLLLGGRIAAGSAAGLGAAVMVPLTAIPARFTELPARPGGVTTVTPVLEVSLTAGLGVLAGIALAVVALGVRLAAVSLTLMTGLAWLLALVSLSPSLAPGGRPALVRLAVLDLPATGGRPLLAVLTPPVLALLICGAIALAARSRGLPPLQTAAATAAAPGVLALAYLIGSPGVGERTVQTSPYAGALLSVATGLLAALLIGVVRPPAVRGGPATAPDSGPGDPDTLTAELPAVGPAEPDGRSFPPAPLPPDDLPTGGATTDPTTPEFPGPGGSVEPTAPPEPTEPAESAEPPGAQLTPAEPAKQPRWLATPLSAVRSRLGRRKRRPEPPEPTPAPPAELVEPDIRPAELVEPDIRPAAGAAPDAPADPTPAGSDPVRFEARTLDLDALNLDDYLPRARAFTNAGAPGFPDDPGPAAAPPTAAPPTAAPPTAAPLATDPPATDGADPRGASGQEPPGQEPPSQEPPGKSTPRKRKSSKSTSPRSSRSTKSTSRRPARDQTAADASAEPTGPADQPPARAAEPEDEHISWISSLSGPPEPDPRPEEELADRVLRRLRREQD